MESAQFGAFFCAGAGSGGLEWVARCHARRDATGPAPPIRPEAMPALPGRLCSLARAWSATQEGLWLQAIQAPAGSAIFPRLAHRTSLSRKTKLPMRSASGLRELAGGYQEIEPRLPDVVFGDDHGAVGVVRAPFGVDHFDIGGGARVVR